MCLRGDRRPPGDVHGQLRKVDGSYQIGSMHYGNVDSFGIANSKNIEKLAKDAGST